MSTDDVFNDTKKDIAKKRKENADRQAQSKLHEQWSKNAGKQAAESLHPQAEAIDVFLTALEKNLGIQVVRTPGWRGFAVNLADGEKSKKVETYSFTCSPETIPAYGSRRDYQLTITLFAKYAQGDRGKAENIEVQVAVDDPFNRDLITSKTVEDGYGGSDTDSYCNTVAVQSPKGTEITKAVTSWLETLAKKDKNLEDKILNAPKIHGIKFPDETEKPKEGNSVRIHVGHHGYYPTSLN